MYCDHCGKPLRKFRVRDDWIDRKYHLKCYKFIMKYYAKYF